MEVSGTVRGGVVVLQEGVDLPEGVRVRVVVQPDDQPDKTNRRVLLPIVPSETPSSVSLSNQKIAEILDDEDLARH